MLPRTTIPRTLRFALCALLLLPLLSRSAAPNSDPVFTSQVAPILSDNCASCHRGAKPKAGLDLTDRTKLLEGATSGIVIVPGKASQSPLVQNLSASAKKHMPPKGQLKPEEIAAISKWIDGLDPKTHVGRTISVKDRQHWAFQKVAKVDPPTVKNEAWIKNPIDRFILARLEQKGLSPAPPADPRTLIRRMTYDMLGLPPTEDEVAAFEQSAIRNPQSAIEELVERLLASPHYGERWARHWLDLVRYAETNSFERDGPKPNAWRYRDYVIRSFNDDKSYAQFIREQLAGDELDPVTTDGIIATGYYRLGQWQDEPVNAIESYYDEMDDIISTTGQAFLGLTVGCARCHDHKIDPMPQKDYYRFVAFFHGIQSYGQRFAGLAASQRPIGTAADLARQKLEIAGFQKKVAELTKEMEALEDQVKPHLEGGERDDFKHEQNRFNILRSHTPKHLSQADFQKYQALRKERDAWQKKKPSGMAEALCVTEKGPTPPETYVFLRGNPHNKGEKIEPGFLTVLDLPAPALPKPAPNAKTAGRRRVLADWLASPDYPLTARVMVNRVWQHHFGRGIVRTSSDFGVKGSPPTHPELLDYLADYFISDFGLRIADSKTDSDSANPQSAIRNPQSNQWSIKKLHRLILLSNAYRMSSAPDPSALARDPENDLFWRFNPRRLSAEELRDSVLAVSGNLNLKMGGPSIHPTIPKEVLAGQSIPGNGWDLKCPPEERARRSVYVHIKRSLAVPILASFDAPDPDASCAVRFATTQPTQALLLLNSEFMQEQAGIMAAHLKQKAGDDPRSQVRMALKRVNQRAPTPAEIDRGVRFIERMKSQHAQKPDEALKSFCLLALNLNEFVYVD